MSPFFLSAASFVCLTVLAGLVSYRAGHWKFPATVALVAVGMLVALAARSGPLAFIDDFALTPDVLFYIFLPILLFESAYGIRYKELLRNIRSITLLSVVSLVISAFFVGFALKYVLGFIGVDVPIEVTLLFGAFISSTDTAAVLAVFKEQGVPRRLNLIFEGESLFNDGTALALFFILLGVVESHAVSGVPERHSNFVETAFMNYADFFGSAFVVAKGLVTFSSMLV